MDGVTEGDIDGIATPGNVDPCRNRSQKININDMQIFPLCSEQGSNLKFQTDRSRAGSNNAEAEGVVNSSDYRGETSERCKITDTSDFYDAHPKASTEAQDESFVRMLTARTAEESSEKCENSPACSDPKSDDEDIMSSGSICARTHLTYDRTKRQCLESKNSTPSLKNNELGNHTVNKRKKTTPQKAMYHLQSVPTDDRQESYWSEDRNFSRLQTPIVTCSLKMNGTFCTSTESKPNGCATGTKAGKRCAETYLSSAHLWPSTQGTAHKTDGSQFEPGWLSAYYANLFFSSFPLMFQNHSSLFPYPFLPSFNNPLNFSQQTSTASRTGVSFSAKKPGPLRIDSAGTKNSDKNPICDPLKSNPIKLNNLETSPLLKFPGDSPTSFWSHARIDDAAQDLKRKYQANMSHDSKALDLSKSGYVRKARKAPSNSRSNFEALENGNILSTLNHPAFSEFMKNSVVPKPASETGSKEVRDYCKNYNGINTFKKSLYDSNYTNAKSLCYAKTLSTTGSLGWMSNELLLQPPLLPSPGFLKWTPEELSEYIEKIDGCLDTAKALRSRGIGGSQLPLLTLDIMTQELGLSMTSAQNLMNIVRNLLSTTIPGESL